MDEHKRYSNMWPISHMSVQPMMSYHMMFSNQFYTMQLFSLCNSCTQCTLYPHILARMLNSIKELGINKQVTICLPYLLLYTSLLTTLVPSPRLDTIGLEVSSSSSLPVRRIVVQGTGWFKLRIIRLELSHLLLYE